MFPHLFASLCSVITLRKGLRIFQIVHIHLPHSWKQEAIKMKALKLTCNKQEVKEGRKGREESNLFLVDVFYILSSQNCPFV